MSSLTDKYAEVIQQHRGWLQNFGKQRLKRWEDLLENNTEAAICEVMTRKLLSDRNVDVRPYEDLSQGGPDFLCVKDGLDFYVEVTCLVKKTITEKSGLAEQIDNDAHSFLLPTKKIISKLSRKIGQCAGVNKPRLVAIANLHPNGDVFEEWAAEDLLTGTTYIAHNVNDRTGEPVGETYEIAPLKDAAFIEPCKGNKGRIEYAKSTISGLLLCAFAFKEPAVKGVLHPNPIYPFERSILPDISFAKLVDGYQNGSFPKFEWI